MKTVALSRQYVVGSAVFGTLSFREPKLADYRQVGPVAELQRDVILTDHAAVWSYAERLVQDIPHGALGDLDLVDALAVEAAITGFFTQAHRQLNARGASSSGSAGDPPTSTA